jgi:hypothetical protein
MRPLPSIGVRAFALATLVVAAAAVAAVGAPACSLIDSASQCQSACDALSACGAITTSDCTGYCATAVSTATYTGCSDQLAAQNTCAQASGSCDSPSPDTCATEVAAFNMCVTNHCTMDPNSDGCPITGDGGLGGGATTGDGG